MSESSPPKLSREALRAAQVETLAAPRRRYSLAARILFAALDVVYGKPRTLAKFRVLELIARVPYQAWEQVAYIATTHTAEDPERARRIFDRVVASRLQQDNEQWHLLIIEELTHGEAEREGFLRARLLPQLIAFVYYQLSWLLYVVHPRWSYGLNADFEDHAEHEYMQFVAENPRMEQEPFSSVFASDYGSFASLADLFRQIGHDERFHKQESLAAMAVARFR